MKVNSKIFKGIEFVQLNQLPPEQRDALLKTINHKIFIKILIDGKIVGQCLQYKDYEIWFENIYKTEKATQQPNLVPTKAVPVNIADNGLIPNP
jgi:hypothetical protein